MRPVERLAFFIGQRAVHGAEICDDGSMSAEVCEKSKELRELGRRVIRDRPDLAWIRECRVRIGYAMSSKQKTKDDRIIFAECYKVKPLWQAFIPYDFVIVFYEPNTMMMDNQQQEILMYHELLHIGMEDNGSLKIRPHDIEDFRVILDEYGMDWNAVEVGDMRGS